MAPPPVTTNEAPPLVPRDEGATLHFNPAEYLEFVENADATDEQKVEFLQAVFFILSGFVDMGFRIHPLQQALAEKDTLESDSISMLKSDNSENEKQQNDERGRRGVAETDS